MAVHEWFLSASERRNPATRLNRRRGHGEAWSTGNAATALVHGVTYFGELIRCVEQLRQGDLLLFTDWRGDPDQLLTDDPDSAVGRVLGEATGRGVDVRGLVWRSHLDKLTFSAAENRHLGEEIEQAGGECPLDMRVRVGGSHHQKLVVLRHLGRTELDVAFVGCIDLCHSRRDDADHLGDPQRQPMAKTYGPRPPAGRTGTRTRCRRSCPTRRRRDRTPYSCCGPTRGGSPATPSRRTASAASRTDTPRRCAAPGAWSTSRTSTCGRPRSHGPSPRRCGRTLGCTSSRCCPPPRPGRPLHAPAPPRRA